MLLYWGDFMGVVSYFTSDINLWLQASNAYSGRLVSPGGAARACGVSRALIWNWYTRDKKVSSFVCKLQSDSYVLVDLDQCLSVASKSRGKTH